jgi:hypothetical protein
MTSHDKNSNTTQLTTTASLSCTRTQRWVLVQVSALTTSHDDHSTVTLHRTYRRDAHRSERSTRRVAAMQLRTAARCIASCARGTCAANQTLRTVMTSRLTHKSYLSAIIRALLANIATRRRERRAHAQRIRCGCWRGCWRRRGRDAHTRQCRAVAAVYARAHTSRPPKTTHAKSRTTQDRRHDSSTLQADPADTGCSHCW